MTFPPTPRVRSDRPQRIIASSILNKTLDTRGGGRPVLEGVYFNRISEERVSWLERAFEEKETLEALGSIDGDKAPGPDSFNASF